MRWIVIDGIDGSGKTTCAMWIKDYYEKRGETTKVFIHPSERLCGRISRWALRKAGKIMELLAALFFIIDVFQSLYIMKSRKEGWRNIVFVRYILATAYLPEKLSEFGYKFFEKLLPVPDKLILIDVDPHIAYKRIMARNEEKEMFEELDHLHRVRDRMLRLSNGKWSILDNSNNDSESHIKLIEILTHWD